MSKPDISIVAGFVFKAESGGVEYGTIRAAGVQVNHPLNETELVHIADDDTGNAFAIAIDGSIVFWDHETDELTTLASSWPEFVEGCTLPSPVKLDQRDVLSAWIDPSFAAEQGIDAPTDGWIIKPKQ